jgi:hypothetical protein
MTQSFRLLGAATCALALLSACEPAPVEPFIGLTPRPRIIDNQGQVSTLTVTTTNEKAQPGTGTVLVTSSIGSLSMGATVTLGSDGLGTVEFSCDVAADPRCTGGMVRVEAAWTTGGTEYKAATTLTVSGPMDAGAGDAGVGDGGTGDGGMMQSDAGDGSDAGLQLAAARQTLFAGVGDFTTLTATLRLGAAPLAGETIDFTTTLGTITQLDGGAGASAVTNSQGQASVALVAGSTPGTAMITATSGATNRTGSLNVEILAVNSITHTLTTCGTGTQSCSVMGIRGSGFNENASVRFRVADSRGGPVTGVRVTFTANNPPNGTTVSPEGVTDAMGVATAIVQSGFAVGAFTVTATVSTVSATSPSIGVRGAKPSNNGITVNCSRVNLAAYVSPTPPLSINNTCTVQLLDRYGNYVGVSQTVNLKSEAGSVPATITTAGFSGSGANEGRGTFDFSTVGRLPDDVEPLAANASQFPAALAVEPSWVDGNITRNPRDGLVTILASVPGEEHFYDDNQNGTRDANERFIDQGEPLLDRNDNNVWDPGEYYEDKNGNNVWDGPNGQWDSDAAVWTVFHILYTGSTFPPRALFQPSTFDVPLGQVRVINVFLPDLNLNRVEAGASLGFMRTATKGSVSLINVNLGLDTYGFGLTSRELLDATGTGPCTNTTSRCTFFTRFTVWNRGYVGDLQLTGASLTDTSPPQMDTITVNTTVRGVQAGAPISGTFQ